MADLPRSKASHNRNAAFINLNITIKLELSHTMG